jgi:hypothetical protein
MYEPGQTVKRYCSIFPASATPWAPPLPVLRNGEAQSVMLRIVVTENYLTFAWQAGQTVNRLDIPVTEEEAAQIGSTGGQIAGFTIGRRGGCRCNANLLNGWDPFPGVNLIDAGAAAPSSTRDPATYGLVPARYSRV